MPRRSCLLAFAGLVPSLLGLPIAADAAGPRDYDGPRDVVTDDVAVPEPASDGVEADPDAPIETPPVVEPPVDPSNDPQVEPELELPSETPATAIATQPWMPRHRLVYRNFIAGRINPLGLVNDLTVGYRPQIVARDTPAFRDSFALVAAHAFLTPAFVRLGPTLEIQPVAAINLGVTYDFVGAFGTFTQLQSFASPTDDTGPDRLRRNADRGLNRATTGHLVTLSALLQAKFGNIAFRTATRGFWSDYRLPPGDRVYYDQMLDIPLPDRGWALINETDLVYLFDEGRAKGLRVAIRHSVTHAFYERRHFEVGEPVSRPNGPTLRAGPGAGYVFFDRPGARFNRPTIFLLSQWWLRHRYRTGERVSAAVPYAAIAFSFEGDLVPHRAYPKRDRRRRPGPK